MDQEVLIRETKIKSNSNLICVCVSQAVGAEGPPLACRPDEVSHGYVSIRVRTAGSVDAVLQSDEETMEQ